MPRPGSIVSRGTGMPRTRHWDATMARSAGRQRLDLGRVVLGHVGDAEPAAQVELGHVHAVLGVDPPGQLEHPVGGHLEAAGVEDLRADVRVQPGELKLREREHPADRLVGGAGGEREAELLVVVRGGHELVRVRLDPGRHPDQDARPRPRPASA